MPEIKQADRERLSHLIELVQAASDEGLPLKDCHDIWLSVLAAHREAERERLRPLIEGSYSAISIAQDGIDPTVEPAVHGEREGLKERLCDEMNGKATTTPPEPRELTAEIVKEMLPATWWSNGSANGSYQGEFGFISWFTRDQEFWIEINGHHRSLSRIGTDRKLAALVAALGIDAGVKHG